MTQEWTEALEAQRGGKAGKRKAVVLSSGSTLLGISDEPVSTLRPVLSARAKGGHSNCSFVINIVTLPFI